LAGSVRSVIPPLLSAQGSMRAYSGVELTKALVRETQYSEDSLAATATPIRSPRPLQKPELPLSPW